MRNTGDAFVHLAHPCPTESGIILNGIAKELSLPLLPFSQWYKVLEEATKNAGDDEERACIPGGLLLEFFKVGLDCEMAGTPLEAMGLPSLDMTSALKASRALRDAQSSGPLGAADVQSWIAYWRDIRYLPTSQA